MFGWFKKKPKLKVVENIGPDVPKVRFRGVVDGYNRMGDRVEMDLMIGSVSVVCPVNLEIQKLFPVGTEVWLVMEKR